MQLDYNILWVDDVDDNITTYAQPIENYIYDHGFNSIIKHCNNEEELKENINDKYYDLIILDYKYNDNPKGTDFIKYIREQNNYACIVLYTAATNINLKEIVKSANIQNVYVYYKNEIVDNPDLITKLVEYALKRDLDINSMRGIVMAELAKFDSEILQIIIQNEYSDMWLDIANIMIKFYRNNCKNIISKNNDLMCKKDCINILCDEIWSKFDIEKMKTDILNPENSTRAFPSGNRVDFLNSQIKKFNIEIDSNNDFSMNFIPDIIQKRNKLAHNIENNIFSEAELLKLRKDILKHRKNLAGIKEGFHKIK